MKLGVFDSGIGGEAIAASLQEAFADAEIIIINDRDNLPYGDKSQAKIIELTNAAIQPLLRAQCDVIVIACNTATSAAIEWLRQTYPSQIFVGLEPMVKSAANLTKSGVIAVCATPATLASERYKKLKHTYITGRTALELDCREWAFMIEHSAVDEQHIKKTIHQALSQKADVIVLACTHYHWIKDIIEKIAGTQAVVVEPSAAVVERVRQLTATQSQQP